MAKQVRSILEFDQGSIMDKVQIEMRKVLDNIADINTSIKPREITVKMQFAPDEKRKHITQTTVVTSKLQPTHASKTSMVMSADREGLLAQELTGVADGQIDLFTGEVHEGKIIKFERKVQ